MSSLILRNAMSLIFPLTLIFAIYMALKGHNEPGGGFIGGLIAATALVMIRMSHGKDAMARLMPFHPRVLIAGGIALAGLTAVVPMAFGLPLLTSRAPYIYPLGHEIHVPTAMFFDLGVLLVVVGVASGMIFRLGEEVQEG
ncbi:MAG: MnhB domain-containing protein [Phycisphaerales bacterium JB063]